MAGDNANGSKAAGVDWSLFTADKVKTADAKLSEHAIDLFKECQARGSWGPLTSQVKTTNFDVHGALKAPEKTDDAAKPSVICDGHGTVNIVFPNQTTARIGSELKIGRAFDNEGKPVSETATFYPLRLALHERTQTGWTNVSSELPLKSGDQK